MRVAIFTPGRFHVLDLARELIGLGHEVTFYSYLSKGRTREYGLPDSANRCVLPYVAPLYALKRSAPAGRTRSIAANALQFAADQVTARLLEPCDALIAMSGLGVATLEAARRRHGAKVFVERGSRHILSQREILSAIGQGARFTQTAVDRELTGYAMADFVSVPSSHVRRSFEEQGFPAERLFVNPYGADLAHFAATPAPAAEPPTVLMTGTWSMRKGCDVLTQAMRLLGNARLLHVGPVGDAPLPTDAWFEHVDPVPQKELTRFYARGHVFALASREEGLALVQLQALACGLPLVCTTRTGGEDLTAVSEQPGAISVVEPDDAGALAQALRTALDRRPPVGTPRNALGAGRDALSWRKYAERYAEALERAVRD